MDLNKYNVEKEESKDLQQINHNVVADQIIEKEYIITFEDNKEMYWYNEETGIYDPCENGLKEIILHICGLKTKTHLINEILNSIKIQTTTPREVVGKEKELIPLENGIYNFETEQLENYSPTKVFLAKHPIVWDEDEPIEENPIDNFLAQITSSQEDHLLLKEMVGYCYYRDMPFQNMFLLYGAGSNGKSVYLNLIRSMIGKENVAAQSLQNLTKNRFAAVALYNKNANVFGDLSSTALSDVGILKELTGGDWITAEQKFKDPFLFKNYAKVIASCNEVPETPDNSDGWHRRIIIINFPNSFEENPDRELLQKLIKPEYLTSFFKSSINAFKEALNDNRLIRKESIEEKRKKYMHFSNSANAFIYDCLELDPDFRIATDILYERYCGYCKEKKIIAQNEIHFFRHLHKMYPHAVYKKREGTGKDRQYFIYGVDFKD